MKKTPILLSLLIASLTVYAQESKCLIGVQITPTITSISGNSMIDNYEKRLMVSPSLTFDYNITNNLSIKSEFAFERKGAKTEMDFTDNTGTPIGSQEIKLNFDYLTLPMMITYSTSGKTKFHFGGGFFVGYLLSQKSIFSGIGNYPELTGDNTRNFKSFDTGLSLAIGLRQTINEKIYFDFGLRENLGLLNTSKVKVVNDGSIKTNSFGIYMGLKYKL